MIMERARKITHFLSYTAIGFYHNLFSREMFLILHEQTYTFTKEEHCVENKP